MVKRLLQSLKTLRVRIMAIAALCWLLPTLVLGVFLSSLFVGAMREKSEQALVSGASHAQEMVVQDIERLLQKSRDVTYDEQLSEYTAQYRAGTMRYEEFFILSRTYWHKMFQREPLMELTAFFLTGDPNMLIHSTGDVNALLDFRQNVLPYILNVGEKLDTQSRFVHLNSHMYHVRNLYSRKLERFGMITLGIDARLLFQPFLNESTLWEGHVDIALDEYRYLDGDTNPFDTEDMQLGLYEEGGDVFFTRIYKTQDFTLQYRIRLDNEVMYGQARQFNYIVIALIVLLLPLEALLMVFIHRKLTRPLQELSEATKRLADGEFGITVPTQGMNEIDSLGNSFNAMSLRMQELINTSYRKELALRDARIAALQSRINPHFLNNALEQINWQARIEGADSVSEMIEAMSTLLNASLDRKDERTVPLRMEMEVVDAYIFFIQRRFGDSATIQKNVDPALLNAHVPRLIIQTLLENAVEHGIGPVGGGTIRLDIFKRALWLVIEVHNDGAPIGEDKKEMISTLLDDTTQNTSGHVGIRNINQRLKLIYNDQAGLTLTYSESEGTLARVILPYEETAPLPAQHENDLPEAEAPAE